MRTRDFRHHAEPEPLHIQAANYLREELAEAAMGFWQGWHETNRYHRRKRTPGHFATTPGAAIERYCSPDQRELLQHLESDPSAQLPEVFRFLRYGEPFIDSYDVTTTGFGPFGAHKTPPTIFKLGPL